MWALRFKTRWKHVRSVINDDSCHLSSSQQCGKKAWEQQFAICSSGPPFAVYLYSQVLCKGFGAYWGHSCLQTVSSHRLCSISAELSLYTPSGVPRGERGGWTLVHAQKMPWPDPSSSEKVIGPFLLCLTFFVNLGTTSDSDSVSLEILCLSADLWMSCSPWQRPPFQVKVGSTC